MPLPNMSELQTMFGAWNPQAYLTGQENLGLERQLVNEDLNKKRQDTRKVELENLFSEQDNPNRIQERVLTNEAKTLENTGKGYANRQAKLETERKEANHWNMLQEDQRTALLKATEDDYKIADARAEVMIRNPDPEIQKQGLALAQLTKSAREAKLAHERQLALETYKQGEETKRWEARNKTSVQVANIGATSRVNVAGIRKGAGGVDFWTAFNTKLKTARDKHAALIAEATKLGDTPEAQIMLNMAEALRPQATAEIATPKPGGIDPAAAADLPRVPPPQIAPPKSREAGGKVTERTGQTANGVKFKVVE